MTIDRNKASRFGRIFLALAMVLTLCLPCIAMANEDSAKEEKHDPIEAIQVGGLKGNPSSVIAYQIAKYDTTQHTYVMVESVANENLGFAKMTEPTGEEITAIAQ